jgi:DNA gyrase/topoisomerase IV subunit A
MSSEYINKSRRDYSLYVLQMRAIPSLADGLKAGGRRIVWTAKDGKMYKSASLAGATMPLHPHASPEGAINTLAAPYGNNIPLLAGKGAFGTLLRPTAYGASRYTSVKISKFTQDVMLKDLELVPLVENYDGSLEEPKHFRPLVPVSLLNPAQGIAIGFATNILPRALEDIIETQILFLKGRKRGIPDVIPYFTPTDNGAEELEEMDNGNVAYYFYGKYKDKNTSTVIVTSLPYGLSHEKFIDHLDSLKDGDVIIDYEDRSKDVYEIEVKFKRGKKDDVVKQLKLMSREIENLTLIDFDGTSVISVTPVEAIKLFTEWRLKWYLKRYQRLHDELEVQIQKYKDILTAIGKNVGSKARTIGSRADLIKYLKSIKIIHTDYISGFPVYRFTKEEKAKVQAKLKDAQTLLKQYKKLIRSENERKKVYINELREVAKAHGKGEYTPK